MCGLCNRRQIVHTVSSIGARWPIVWTMWTIIYFYIEKSNKYIVLMAYMVILLEQASDCKVTSTLSTLSTLST